MVRILGERWLHEVGERVTSGGNERREQRLSFSGGRGKVDGADEVGYLSKFGKVSDSEIEHSSVVYGKVGKQSVSESARLGMK